MAKTLVDIQRSIGDWLNLNDNPGEDGSARLPKSVRADIANIAIRELLRKHDTKFGQFSTTFQTVDEVLAYPTTAFVPGVFSRPQNLWYLDPLNVEKSVVVEYVDKTRFDEIFPVAGIYGYPVPMGGGVYGQTQLGDPTYYTYWAGKIELGLVPNRAFTMFMSCYRLLPDLVADTDTNAVLDDAWEYVLFKSCSMSSLFGVEDERIPAWDAKANSLAMDLAVEHYAVSSSGKRRVQSHEPG